MVTRLVPGFGFVNDAALGAVTRLVPGFGFITSDAQSSVSGTIAATVSFSGSPGAGVAGTIAASVNFGGGVDVIGTIASTVAFSGVTQATTGIAITDFPIAPSQSDVARIFQRAPGLTTRDIDISGTFTGGAFSALNFVVNIVAGGSALSGACTNVVCNGGAGTWTATIPNVPQGAWYKAQVTEPLSLQSSTQTKQWGVGFDALVYGQSNNVRLYSMVPGGVSNQYTRRWCGKGWFKPDDTGQGHPTENENGGGEGMVELANKIQAGLGGTIPVGILEYAFASQSVASFKNGGVGSNIFDSGTTGVYQAGCAPEFECVIMLVGETPDGDNGSTPGTYYAADMQTIYTQLQAKSGRDNTTLKFGIAMLGTAVPGTGTSDTNFDIIRAADWAAATTTTGMFFLGATHDNKHLLNSPFHWDHYLKHARRCANAILKALGISVQGSEGPRIVSGVWPVGSALLTLTVEQRSGGTALLDGTGNASGAGLEGFVLTPGSGGQTASNWRLSANTILADMSAVRGGGDSNPTVTYMAGKNPTAWIADPAVDTTNHFVYDNNSTLIGDALGLPLLPTTANAGGNISVGTGAGGGGIKHPTHASMTGAGG